MNLQTFQAATMAEALAQVKVSLGLDAVILHTRTFHKHRWLGLRGKEVVEITAGQSPRDRDRTRRSPATEAYRREMTPRREMPAMRDVVVREAPAQRTALAPLAARVRSEPGRELLETPAAQTAVMAGIAQEMSALKSMVKDLVNQTRAKGCPSVPEELFNYYSQLIENNVAEDLAADIIKTLQKQVRPEHFQQPEFMREKLAEQLEKLIPSSGPIRRTKLHGAHVVALIGPTGVGKTTTIAKIAANLKIRERHKVGLITIDTYRIAAIDQLKKYADIIGAPLRVVGTAEDLRDAVAAMQDCEFILIDTAGRSPNDTLKLNELKTFLAAAAPDEVHLVLSTTASQECVELAISRFTEVRVDKIIFTKLDEAAHVGVVLNVAKKLNKSLSYLTTGQDVPDDIEESKGRRLAQLILGGEL